MSEIIDLYEHVNEKCGYILENIPTSEMVSLAEEHLTVGCDCFSQCNESCKCLKRATQTGSTQTQYSYTDINDIGSYTFNFQTPGAVFECNTNCACYNKKCGNRLVQFGPRKHLRVKMTAQKGFGLFTEKPIVKGNFICEYAGEILSETEGLRRLEKISRLGRSNYIFQLRESSKNGCVLTYIDASFLSNIGRYINHNCNPNCAVVPVRVDSIVPKLAVFAVRNIECDEELCYDYGGGDATKTSCSVTDGKVVKMRRECLCGSDICQGFLPFIQIIGSRS